MDETLGTPPTDEPALPGFLPTVTVDARAAPYRVLARKYRPQTFDDLIGQAAMVRTLSNAFEAGRIPHAWMLTGVRGVGKTTTARILARALNYDVPGESVTGPTIQMPRLGVHCRAIIDGSHIDVMEIDAASNNGVDNVRQISDAVRYAPASARYKVYIVDEVHMLSSGAFNAFLKTLEEPPPHVKFVFATTEIRKVPVTILSRCQRFDLRRVDSGMLVEHLERICGLEGVEAEPEALASIVRAADGSVRDALSLLDQAIAHGAGQVAATTVREMLGLADRAQVIDLFEAVMRGDIPAAFALLQAQYEAGADPATILSDLAAFCHLVTRLKLVPDSARDPGLTETERRRGTEFAAALSMPALSRAWQVLLKAIPEIEAASRPLAAAEMALVRLAYAADLPRPDEALRALKDHLANSGSGKSRASPSATGAMLAPPVAPALSAPPVRAVPVMAATSSGSAAPARAEQAPRPAPNLEPKPESGPRLHRFEDVIALAGERREIGLKGALERDVHLVRFEEGRIEFALAEGAGRTLPNDLARALDLWTGRRWIVALSSEPGAPTLKQQKDAAARDRRHGVTAHPLVQAVLSTFPGAEIVDVRDKAPDPVSEIDPVGGSVEAGTDEDFSGAD